MASWDDREKSTTFIPCDYCKIALESLTGACASCDYQIILNCLSTNTDN